jgi:hypothetical protein
LKKKFIQMFDWLWALLCALAIFFTVPLARTIQRFVYEKWGRSLFGYFVLLSAAVAFIFALYLLIFKLKIRSVLNYVWLTAAACGYVYFTLRLWNAPEEAVHFLEYGLLGFFLFNALKHKIRDRSIYLAAFLIGCLVGTFDEILQWMVPGRFWDFRDVGLNALSSGLFQFALWMGIKPKIISEKIRPRSIRTVSLLLAANLLILGLCFSNTPQRVMNYSQALPFLSFLQKEEAMNQFNLRHTDPEIGIFFSRLSIEELFSKDAHNTDDYAQVLWDWKDRDYGEYLRQHNGIWTPFLHEIRVHIYRRDKRYEQALGEENENSRMKNFFIAYKENQILEKYFGRTLEASPYYWGDERRSTAEAFIDKDVPYKSPVSATLFTPKNELQLWLIILSIWILLFLLNGFLSRRQKQL